MNALTNNRQKTYNVYMSKTTSLNIRIDIETRAQLKEFSTKVGIPASSLINASIKQMIRTQAVSFNTGLTPTPYLEKILQKADTDIKAGKNISKVYSDVDEFFDDLDKKN